MNDNGIIFVNSKLFLNFAKSLGFERDFNIIILTIMKILRLETMEIFNSFIEVLKNILHETRKYYSSIITLH